MYAAMYRVTHLRANLGWVDFHFGCSALCLVLPGTPLETVYIGCPKQALVLARSGDHGDYENIFVRKIVLAL